MITRSSYIFCQLKNVELNIKVFFDNNKRMLNIYKQFNLKKIKNNLFVINMKNYIDRNMIK